MTNLEFQKLVKDKRRKDDYFNYFLCIVFIAMGLYFFTKTINEIIQTQTYDKGAKFGLFTVGLVPLIFGLYGFWRIPKCYLTKTLFSNLPKLDKTKIIDNYFTNVKLTNRQDFNDLYEIQYQNKYLTYINVTIFIDNEKFLYYVTGADLRGSKGFIDFGISKRATKRLTNYLENACLQH